MTRPRCAIASTLGFKRGNLLPTRRSQSWNNGIVKESDLGAGT
jgi:hypothetical protein